MCLTFHVEYVTRMFQFQSVTSSLITYTSIYGFPSLLLTNPPQLGIIPDCHQWHPGAPKPWETVAYLPGLPQPLSRDGRREKGWGQRAAAGESLLPSPPHLVMNTALRRGQAPLKLCKTSDESSWCKFHEQNTLLLKLLLLLHCCPITFGHKTDRPVKC